ncbi:hypothetical protein DKX38_024220 [Salix brachista]|uniref:DYW domain-containing protein n=1 Tax=Salix brachista TaxID=2182728 RepID=A0A5N5JKS2_9ROSI|nr:hypothetical protein DKX38_024220 [Salix brachista]
MIFLPRSYILPPFIASGRGYNRLPELSTLGVNHRVCAFNKINLTNLNLESAFSFIFGHHRVNDVKKKKKWKKKLLDQKMGKMIFAKKKQNRFGKYTILIDPRPLGMIDDYNPILFFWVLHLFYGGYSREKGGSSTVVTRKNFTSIYSWYLELIKKLRETCKSLVLNFFNFALKNKPEMSYDKMENELTRSRDETIMIKVNVTIIAIMLGHITYFDKHIKYVDGLFNFLRLSDTHLGNAVIAAYIKLGLVVDAYRVFMGMSTPDVVSYSAIISSFSKLNREAEAIQLFFRMRISGIEPNEYSFVAILTACIRSSELELGRQIHAHAIRIGLENNLSVGNAIIRFYTGCGSLNHAVKCLLYQSTDGGNTIIQTSMICGYARNGLPEEAICLFYRSQSEGTMVLDEVAFTSILGVCGTLGFHEMGKQIHCHALKTGFHSELGVGNSTISMYSKCYNIDDAIKAFNTMPAHNIVSWNGLIAGQLLHRQGNEALAIWSSMEKAGIKPDTITFVLIVSAYKYTSSNLLDECRSLFLSMKMIHDLEPTSEHYASLVGVLGYWGLLEEAEELINKMPFEPEVSVWRALLDSCRLHANTSIGKRVAKHIIGMEPRDPSTYVLVSNLYAASGRWHCSEIVRENMRDRGLRKHPCRSWVINKKKLHTFYARDKSHPQAKDIYSGLDILILKCLKAGYEPDMSFVLQEVEEQQKKNFLFYHSAKLAATYGLLKTRPGEPIRVVKNILLCRDCHSFLQYASVVTQREILFRDASGFHCFSNGQCSCKGYW